MFITYINKTRSVLAGPTPKLADLSSIQAKCELDSPIPWWVNIQPICHQQQLDKLERPFWEYPPQ